MQLLINNWGTSLALAAAIGDATIAVDAPSAARLVGLGTGDYYLLTLAAVGSDGAETAWEIVKVTSVAGGVLSVVRGQEGTAARAWTALSPISARVTKGTLDGLRGAAVGNAAPLPLGVADPGASAAASRDDHVHQLPSAAAIGAIASSEKGSALGVATLDAGQKIPLAQLPATAITDTFVVASQAAMLALTAQTGDVAIRPDISSSYILQAEPASTLGNWQLILTPASGGGAAVGSSVPHALGAATPGVSGYASREDHVHPMPSAADVGAATAADLAAKVDKVTGKGLSTEDYTTGEKSKLSGVSAGATANSTDSALRDRSSHTGTQAASTISDFTEAAQDAIAALLVAGTNVTLSYSDASNQLTINASAPAAAPAAVVTDATTARASVLADASAYLRFTNAAATTYTVQPQSSVAWPADAEVHVRRAAAGNLTLTAGAGVTLNTPSGGTLVMTNAMSVTLKRVASDVWDVIGQTVAA